MQQELILKKKELVEFFLKDNILISSDIFVQLDEAELYNAHKIIMADTKTSDFLILNNDIKNLFCKSRHLEVNWLDLEKSMVLLEKGKNKKVYKRFIDYLTSPKTEEKPIKVDELPELETPQVKVISSYKEESVKREIQDFVKYYSARYKALEAILMQRPDLTNITSINRII